MTPDQRTVTTSASTRTVPTSVTDSGNSVPDIVFVGGAPGVGKTSIARPLAARLGMNLTQVDDFYIVLERMTDPKRYPAVHEWRLHPDRVLALDDAQMIEHTRSVSEVIAEAMAPVIADRLDNGVRSVFEGDFIQPSFAASSAFDGVAADGRVRSVFIHDTEERLVANISARDGEEQPRRARISFNYGEWLRVECDRYRLPAIPARPWETAVDRAQAAISRNNA
jgi:2-phosphoglycerate kinase